MGLYIAEQDVKDRLISKVAFTDDPNDKNRMQTLLLRRLIREGEGQVEMDLSPRYEIPIQGIGGEAFRDLPVSPTRDFIRTLCELQAVMRILETDFGKGSISNGDAYSEKLKTRYDNMVAQMTARWEEKAPNSGKSGWVYPPMKGLRLAIFNTEADDGYSGMVMVVGGSASAAFPHLQINDPSQNWTNGIFEDLK